MTSHQSSFVLLLLVGASWSIPQYQGVGVDPGSGVGGAFTPQQSAFCETGFDCVPWQSCIEGYIASDGGSGLDQRTHPANYETLQCGQNGNMCCGISQFDAIRADENQCGHSSYDCVPYFNCVDGEINTDGAGLIDIRLRPTGVCTNNDYPDVPAVCCLKPGAIPTPAPVVTCPGFTDCVEYSLCSADGTINTDGTGIIDIRTGYTSCYLESGIGGICCTPPPPFLDNCPSGSVCVIGSDCNSQALDAANIFVDYISTGFWTHCNYGSGDGVCCSFKTIDACPSDSVCVQAHECTGTALDGSNVFVDYVSTGFWTHCTGYDQGVCCINPYTVPDLHPATTCGVRNYQLQQKISGIGDNEAKFGEFPWQSIIFYQNYTFNCGASLISNKHVITAAHCVDNLLPGDIRIRFGEWQVNSFEELLPYEDRNVHTISIHPDFNPKNVHNDIAVLELIEPLELKYHINTACLPSAGQVFDPNYPCFATGWGKDSFTGTFQHILKKIDLPYVDHSTCQNLLRNTRLGKYFKLDQSFVCAGGLENQDACYGDGGGPLVCKDKNTERYVLTGITSWGIGCGTKNVPGVYADVQLFNSWVDNIVLGGQQSIPGYGK